MLAEVKELPTVASLMSVLPGVVPSGERVSDESPPSKVSVYEGVTAVRVIELTRLAVIAECQQISEKSARV